jgi:hypothetical protein
LSTTHISPSHFSYLPEEREVEIHELSKDPQIRDEGVGDPLSGKGDLSPGQPVHRLQVPRSKWIVTGFLKIADKAREVLNI